MFIKYIRGRGAGWRGRSVYKVYPVGWMEGVEWFAKYIRVRWAGWREGSVHKV